MKRLLLLALLLPVLAFGQVIFNMDSAPADTNYWAFFDNHGGKHYQTNGLASDENGWIKISYITDNVFEGSGAMQLEYSAHNKEGWGGYTKLEHWHPDSTAVYDWSKYDSVCFWYNNTVAQSAPGKVHLRFNLHDVSHSTEGANTYDVTQTEYYYSFEYILDEAPGWHRFALPLLDGRNEDKMDEWNGGAFNRTGWSGIEGNDKLDLDKIKGYSLEFSISGAGEGDFSAGTIILDNLTLCSLSKKPIVFFNGRALAGYMGGGWTWGQSNLVVEPDAGPIAGTNAILWTQGNEWGNGWSGIGWSMAPAVDMSSIWDTDSLKFKMKTDEGVGPLRVQFEDGAAKIGMVFNPITDGAWHQYAFKLTDFEYKEGANFKNTAVTVLGFMGEASAIAGKKVYISDLWTGNPVIDVVAPQAVAGVNAVAGEYYNLVYWEDVPGETKETYNVYASENPITDVTAEGVDLVAAKVEEDKQTYAHFIYYPIKDKQVTMHYTVVCTDEAGNISPMGNTASIANLAKGIATVQLKTPAFVADGDLSEWDAAGITPMVMKPSTTHWAIGTFNDDNDLNAKVYMAIDDENLYLAFDVIDDVYSYDPAGDWWQDDAIEIFLGMYEYKTRHNGFKRGAEPDYQFAVMSTGFRNDKATTDAMMFPNDSPNYKYLPLGAQDYIVEIKIPLDSLAYGNTAGDARFHPKNGMRFIMDICLHDADTQNVRDGVLSFSNINEDNSWNGPQNWGLTWIGDTTKVTPTAVRHTGPATVASYELQQNYPNPFNPETRIHFTLPNTEKVKLTVFNQLGQQVAVLVDGVKPAGAYSVSFRGDDLPSGLYFYRIQAGSYNKTLKMLLMK